jgi:hypothetical protein
MYLTLVFFKYIFNPKFIFMFKIFYTNNRSICICNNVSIDLFILFGFLKTIVRT